MADDDKPEGLSLEPARRIMFREVAEGARKARSLSE
jgi:hypothetical protein